VNARPGRPSGATSGEARRCNGRRDDARVGGLTVTEVRGFGKQYGHIDPADRLAERRVLILPKHGLDLVVRDEAAEPVARAIAKAVGVGEIGDGKIWAAPVDGVLRIRTGERDDDAL
jgi:nitrogen regulatory protein P-II 1